MRQLLAIKKFGERYPEALQTIGFRRKERFYLQNLDFPADRVTFKHDSEQRKITIEITLNEDEYLAVGSTSGIATKQTIEG